MGSLWARVKDWVLGTPDEFDFILEVTARDIMLADCKNTPIDLAVTRQRVAKSFHSTRTLYVRFDRDVYEADLPRPARNFVWEWNQGRAPRPFTVKLHFQRIKGSKGKWQQS